MNGQDYKLLLEAGYALLKKNAEEINDLNVIRMNCTFRIHS